MKNVSTEEFARLHLVKAQTILKNHSEKGHYFGVVPSKLPNGRLLWPIEDREESSPENNKHLEAS